VKIFLVVFLILLLIAGRRGRLPLVRNSETDQGFGTEGDIRHDSARLIQPGGRAHS